MDCATEITIGIINAALAVFDVNSVKKIINAVITKQSTQSGLVCTN